MRNDIDLDLAHLDIDADEVIEGFRTRYGSYQVGSFEADPQQLEYDEMVDLAQSLGGSSRCRW